MEYIIALIGLLGTVAGTIFGALLANYLSGKTASKAELRSFLTDAYTQVTANYLLFIDGKATRGEIVAAIEKTSLLCPPNIKPSLKSLENAVLAVSDIRYDDLSACAACFAVFNSLSREHIDKMWKKRDRV